MGGAESFVFLFIVLAHFDRGTKIREKGGVLLAEQASALLLSRASHGGMLDVMPFIFTQSSRNGKPGLLKLDEVLLCPRLNLDGGSVAQGLGDLFPTLHLNVFRRKFDKKLLETLLLLWCPGLVKSLGLFLVEDATSDQKLTTGRPFHFAAEPVDALFGVET